MNLLPYLVVAVTLVVPGLALTRLVRPDLRWLGHLAAAPLVTFAIFYAAGLVLSLLGLPILVGVGVLLGGLVLGWVGTEVARAVTRRRRGASSPEVERRVPLRVASMGSVRLASAVLLVLAVVLGLVFWRQFQSQFVVPPSWDAMHHGYFIRQLVDFDTLDPRIVLAPSPNGDDGIASFYPLAFDLMVGVMHHYSGAAISDLMIATTTIIAGAFLPLGAYVLARRISPGTAMVPAFAALASTLPVYLYWILESGRTNAVLGLALVPVLVYLLLDRRVLRRWRAIVLPAIAVLGMIGLHTSEVPMAAVMAGAVMIARSIGHRSVRELLRWTVRIGGAGLAAVVTVIALDRSLLGAATERAEIFNDTVRRSASVGDAVAGIVAPGLDLGRLLEPAAVPTYVPAAWAVLVVGGMVVSALPRWRAFLPLSVVYVFFAGLVVGLQTGVLGPLAVLTVPWYRDQGRVAWALTVLGAFPAAVALGAVTAVIAYAFRRMPSRTSGTRTGGASLRRRSTAVASILVVGATLLVAAPPVAGAGRAVNDAKGPVGTDSLAAFEFLSRNVGAGRTVFDDVRVDGSLWMYIDDGVLPLFGNSPYVGAEPLSWRERLWVRENLERIGRDDCVLAVLDRYDVQYVYYGERIMADGYHRMSLAFLQESPYFTEAFHEGGVHVFRVEYPDDVPECTRALEPTTRNAFPQDGRPQ